MLNSRMYAKTSCAPFATLVHNQEQRSRKVLQSNQKVESYFLRKIATDVAGAEQDASVVM